MNVDELETKGGAAPITVPSEIKTRLDEQDEKLAEALAAAKSAPSASEIKSLQETIAAIKRSVEDLPADYSRQIKAISDQVDAFQTGAALHTAGRADVPSGIKAITHQIMDSEAYKSIFGIDGQRGQQAVKTVVSDSYGQWSERTQIESFAAAGYKAPSPVLISDMAGSDTTARRVGTVEARDFSMDIMSRIPSVITAGAATYAVPRETLPSRYGAWKTTLAAAVDGDPTPKSTATMTDSDGCMIGSVHRFWTGNTLLGSAVVVSFDPSTDVVTYVTNSLDFDVPNGSTVTSENYAAIAEGSEKPNGYLQTATESFTLKTLASIIPTTVNALNTIQGMAALIERKLPMRDRRNMSRHLLYGLGTADELQGLRTYSGAQSYLWSSGISGDNQADAVMRAINLIPWGVPIDVIMSQADLMSLTLLKGSDGHYLRTGNFGQVPLSQIGLSWFLGAHELVFDYATASGDFTVINFSGASEIADQNTASLMWGYSGDDFLKNIIRARYEATRAHAIVDPNEYVVCEWDSAP